MVRPAGVEPAVSCVSGRRSPAEPRTREMVRVAGVEPAGNQILNLARLPISPHSQRGGYGAPGRNRTGGLSLRRRALCPLSYRDEISQGRGRRRVPVPKATTLWPKDFWFRWSDSSPRPARSRERSSGTRCERNRENTGKRSRWSMAASWPMAGNGTPGRTRTGTPLRAPALEAGVSAVPTTGALWGTYMRSGGLPGSRTRNLRSKSPALCQLS